MSQKVYVGALDPDGKEVSGEGYARVQPQEDGGVMFPKAAGDWGRVTRIVVFIERTGGKPLRAILLTATVTVNKGDQLCVTADPRELKP